VTIPGTRPSLYADFVLPTRKLMVEVHGQQHYEQIQFFHDKREFAAAKRRDAQKKEWCNLNSFTLVELPYSEDVDEWRERVINRGNTPGC
jgi:very-short-patch-repair endonuclease